MVKIESIKSYWLLLENKNKENSAFYFVMPLNLGCVSEKLKTNFGFSLNLH